MRLKIGFAAAAVGVIAMAAGGCASAKTATHRKAPTAEARDRAALRNEIETLKGQVQTLAARVEAQTAAQQHAAAETQAASTQIRAAQANAQQATAQLAADDSRIATIPSQVATAVKANASKPGWWNDTKIGVSMFADVSHIANTNDAGRTAQSGTDYDVKRIYFIVDHRFNDTYTFNFTTDFAFDNNLTSPSGAARPTNNEAGGANTAGGVKATQLFIKKAYLQAHYSDAFNVRLGSAEQAWIPFVENQNGYRYVENMLVDRTKYGTTTDWGVHVFGNLFHGILGYQLDVVDGQGFRQPSIGTANRTDTVDVEGRVNATYDHITVAVGGYEGKLGNGVTGVNTYNTAQRFDAFVGYSDSRFRISGEYFWARYWGDVTQLNPAKTNVSNGYSAFAAFNFTPKLGLFGRYDWVKPKADTAPGENDSFYDLGVSYKLIPAVEVALVYKRDQVLNGSLTTSDGVIGIPTGATTGVGTYDEIGLFTWVKF